MNFKELLPIIQKVSLARTKREVESILSENPILFEQKTFLSLMEKAYQAMHDEMDDMHSVLQMAIDRIGINFVINRTELNQSQVSTYQPQQTPDVVWTLKARQYLALRHQEMLEETIKEAQGQNGIISFLEATAKRDLALADEQGKHLIQNLQQMGRNKEALTIILLCTDIWVELIKYPLQDREDIKGNAVQACKDAIKIAKIFFDDACQSYYLGMLACCFWNDEQFPEAEYFINESIRLWKDLAQQEPDLYNYDLALSLTNLGNIQRQRQKLPEAERAYGEAITIYEDLCKKTQPFLLQNKADLLRKLGTIQWETGKLPDAELSFNLSVQLYKNLNLQESDTAKQSYIEVLTEIGHVQFVLDRTIDAERSFKEALQFCRNLPDEKQEYLKDSIAMVLSNLGNVELTMQRLEDAERSYSEGLNILKTLADDQNTDKFDKNIAAVQDGLGLAQKKLGNLSAAEQSCSEALKILQRLVKQGDNSCYEDLAKTLSNYGKIQVKMGNLPEAEKSFVESLEIKKKLAEQTSYITDQDIVGALSDLGTLQLDQDKNVEAKKYFELAKVLIDDLRTKNITIDDRNRILQQNVTVYNGLLSCYIKTNDWKKALEIAELGKSRSLSDLLNLKSEELQPKASTSDTVSIVADLGNQYATAIKELQQIESYERHLSIKLFQAGDMIKRIKYGSEAKGIEEAFLRQIEKEKKLLEEEKMRVQKERFAKQIKLKNILKHINIYDKDFPLKSLEISSENIFTISKEENRIIIIFRILRKSTAVIFVFPTGEIHIEELAGFGQDEMSNLFSEKWMIPYLNWKRKTFELEILQNKSDRTLDEKALEFEQWEDNRKWIQSEKKIELEKWKTSIEQTLDTVYEKILIHVLQIIKEKSYSKQILFIPNQSLALLPLHAASWKDEDNKKHYLLEEYTITYASSVSVFKRCQQNVKQRSNKTLFVTNPKGDLDFSEYEVSSIKELYLPNRNLLKETASKSVVINELQDDYNFIHFSCHAFYDQDNPFNSGLEMSDEIISLAEILNFNLKSNWLTTLSACETGMVDFRYPTDEYFGLPLGFIFAGSPSVWASLWSVSDIATSELMQKAYENLSIEKYRNNKPEALRQAQLAMIKEYPHPFFWAGFQHFGV